MVFKANSAVSFRQKIWCGYSISLVPRILRMKPVPVENPKYCLA
nr:MAG TPA: hypothetical protein [Caudoviricetes sp.]